MSVYRVSVVNLWRSTEETEKKRIVTHFIKTHGEKYVPHFISILGKARCSLITYYQRLSNEGNIAITKFI